MRWAWYAHDAVGAAVRLGARLKRRVLVVEPRVAYAIGREAIASGNRPRELAAIARQAVAPPTLCLALENRGREAVTVEAIGLVGWFDTARVAMSDPLLHDAKPWPRRLDVGETVVAYLTPRLQDHPVLPEAWFAFARSVEGEEWLGTGAAIPYYLTAVREPAAARKLRDQIGSVRP